MPESSVVNLLDMRDDEEENKGREGGGGRWAGRNPKAKAKAGGRNRRARNRGDGEEGGRRSGFGGRRLNSQASNLSDYSDFDEEEDAQAKLSNASEPKRNTSEPKPAPPAQVATTGSNELFSKLQNEEGAAKPIASQDVTKAMLQRNEDLEAATPSNVSDGGGEIFSEARQIAKYRALLVNESPGLTGPQFKQSVWEYYMVKGTLSDKMCVALDHMSMLPCCAVPCLWPYRLCRTIQRSAPVKIKMCKCCNCQFGPSCACPMSTFIFSLPILAGLLFLPQVSAYMKTLLMTIPNIPTDDAQLDNIVLWVSIGLCCFLLFLTIFWWARVLLGVSMKYSIVEAIDQPDKFACKTMGCICCMNMRVGVHVDRAQGFEKAVKTDNTVIELSDTMRHVNPTQQVMV